MAELSPALAAALAGERPLMVGFVEINLPGYDLCLLDGAGAVPAGAKTFVGRDPVYGVLDSVKGLSDSMGDSAPALTLGLIPAGDAALSGLVDPAVQGSVVTTSIAVVDPATGQFVGTYDAFVWELDVPTIKWGMRDRRLEYRCGSVADRLFQVEEGHRLSDAFHRSIWPGEEGLSLVTDVETYVPWGQKLDLTAVETRTDLPAMGQITTQRT